MSIIGRGFSSFVPNGGKLLWIQGGNSYIAQFVRKEARKRNWTIFSAQRSNLEPTSSDFHFVKLSSNDIYDPGKIKSLMDEKIGDFKGPIVFLNTVGGAHAEEGSTLEKINKTSALCFANSVSAFLENKEYKNQSTLIHCSSIAAALLEDEYGRIKKKTDEELLKECEYTNIHQILCFRIGYVVHSLLEGGIVKDAHDFGPEQLARYSPVQPIIVDGGKEGEIYPVHVKDIVTAVMNAPNFNLKCSGKIRQTVNVVGSHGYSQSKFFEFYTEIFNRDFIPLEIKVDDFETIANNFPHGHIAKYAAEYTRVKNPKLDEGSFKKLVGSGLTPLEEIKLEIKANPDKKIIVSYPFFRYAYII